MHVETSSINAFGHITPRRLLCLFTLLNSQKCSILLQLQAAEQVAILSEHDESMQVQRHAKKKNSNPYPSHCHPLQGLQQSLAELRAANLEARSPLRGIDFLIKRYPSRSPLNSGNNTHHPSGAAERTRPNPRKIANDGFPKFSEDTFTTTPPAYPTATTELCLGVLSVNRRKALAQIIDG